MLCEHVLVGQLSDDGELMCSAGLVVVAGSALGFKNIFAAPRRLEIIPGAVFWNRERIGGEQFVDVQLERGDVVSATTSNRFQWRLILEGINGARLAVVPIAFLTDHGCPALLRDLLGLCVEAELLGGHHKSR